MVENNHVRWDFIGLSTDTKPTPADSENVTNGSTFYCSDTSKLYVWYNDQWYEKQAQGGGGGGPTVVQSTGTSTTDVMSQNAVTLALADLSERVVRKAGAPTTSTEGVLGQLWEDSQTGDLYKLNSIDTSGASPIYTWEKVAMMGQVSGSTETYIIETTDWSALTESSPYDYQTTVIATYPIDSSTVVELLNDNPIQFANHGFAIGNISGQNVTLYSIGQSSTVETLKINYKG